MQKSAVLKTVKDKSDDTSSNKSSGKDDSTYEDSENHSQEDVPRTRARKCAHSLEDVPRTRAKNCTVSNVGSKGSDSTGGGYEEADLTSVVEKEVSF